MKGRSLFPLGLALMACAPTEPKPEAAPVEPIEPVESPSDLYGRWVFELQSPGGTLPFVAQLDAPDRGALVDAHEVLPFSRVEFEDGFFRAELGHYDSVLVGKLESDGDAPVIQGMWSRRSPGKDAKTVMSFEARRGDDLARFADVPPTQDFDGRWRLEFKEEDGSTYQGLAKLNTVRKEGERPRIEGTILTDTGDYRFLEGTYNDGVLQLSVFDGAHAFLFRAKGKPGERLFGDFWSRDAYHATFEGTPLAEDDADGLGDPFALVELTSKDRRFHFDFPRLGGGRLDDADPSLQGKPLVVEIFGTWCPNCNDQAPLMTKWYGEYQPKGLEMVGIAFEFTGDEAEDMEMLRRYADKYGVSYPLLLGGTNDKKKAAERLPDLSKVVAYPTTLFIDRTGEVQSVYTGFSGPATGADYDKLQAEFRKQMDALVAPP